MPFKLFFLRVDARSLLLLTLLLAGSYSGSVSSNNPEEQARDIIRQAIDHYRGLSSYSEMTMTIHRPDWERKMSLQGWSSGGKKTLIRVTAPPRDQGSATLVLDDNKIWSFAPKINRVIRIPSSMMSQSWMGSDFSNKDVSRTDEIVDKYTHTLLRTDTVDGQKVYVIESIPLEESSIVWGKEIAYIRDDFVELEHEFLDQDMKLVKSLKTLEIKEMSGRMFAVRQRMTNTEKEDEWTEISINVLDFDRNIPDYIFTLSNLRNPR
ncbi:MAG: outer membrane lipoprotein-sorting protein [Gammaproteobacteria bacterium]|nr:MAG: outer membrane lipoprotein-sorting protein [Gammaproteobacteria bacterium]